MSSFRSYVNAQHHRELDSTAVRHQCRRKFGVLARKYPVSMRQHAPNSGSGMCFRPTPQAEQQASSAPLGRGTPALLLRQGALVSHSDPRPKDTVSFFMTDGEPNATNTQNACLRPPADTDLEQRNWEIGDV